MIFGRYSISETFDVGADNGGSVNRRGYASPFKFTGQLEKVDFQLQPMGAVSKKNAEQAEAAEAAVD